MYDTIYLTKKIQGLNTESWKQTVDSNGEIIKAQNTISVGESNFGHKRDIKLFYDSRSNSLLITFNASILLKGTNLYDLDLTDEKDKRNLFKIINGYLNRFCDESIQDFNVSRLDTSKNIILDMPTKYAIQSLSNNSPINVGQKEKKPYPITGISFDSNRETFLIYDKIKNEEKKKYIIPQEFLNKYVLRIENQLKKSEAFKTKGRFGKSLTFKEVFYKKNISIFKKLLIENFKNIYFQPSPKRDPILIASEIKRLQGCNNLLNKLFAVLCYQSKLLNLDTVSKIVKNEYVNPKKRDINSQLELIELADKINPVSCYSHITQQIIEQLGAM